jgi:hypothetical protein
MSIVPPAAALDEPPPALLLLPLLLQPAAARAIAAKAAIAGIRLIVFLSLICMARPPRGALTGRSGLHSSTTAEG